MSTEAGEVQSLFARVALARAGGDGPFFYAQTAVVRVWAGDYVTDFPTDPFDLCWAVGVGGGAIRVEDAESQAWR